MNVLIACERSGVVREAFRARGHHAYSCDLEAADDASPYHLRCDVRSVLSPNQDATHPAWDLMIAHPDCRYLSSSGLHRNLHDAGRRRKTEAAIDFVRALLAAPIERIALENPVGCIGTRIRPADQWIQPYDFGDDASKRTGLWLKNLAPLQPTCYVQPRLICQCGRTLPYDHAKDCPTCHAEPAFRKPRWNNQTDSGQNRLGPSPDRARLRARTYPGIAAAMAEQWTTPSPRNPVTAEKETV